MRHQVQSTVLCTFVPFACICTYTRYQTEEENDSMKVSNIYQCHLHFDFIHSRAFREKIIFAPHKSKKRAGQDSAITPTILWCIHPFESQLAAPESMGLRRLWIIQDINVRHEFIQVYSFNKESFAYNPVYLNLRA